MTPAVRAAVSVGLAAALLGACTASTSGPAVTTRAPRSSPASPVTGPGSASAAMERLCKLGRGSGGRRTGPREGPTPPAISEVEREVEQVRELRYTSPVSVAQLAPAEIERRVRRSFQRTTPVDQYARRSLAWQTIGVIPRGTSIREAELAFQTGQVVGYYNPTQSRLVFAADQNAALDQVERFTLAHELTHALDDQHFGLLRLDALLAKCREEAFAAALGAIEGNAQYTAALVLLRFPDLGAPLGSTGGASVPNVPPFIRELELWPYVAGQAFVQALVARGGERAVNQAIQDLPVSTEQVMHPARYPTDTPQPVDVRDLGPSLGHGWRDLDVMEVGEAWLDIALSLRLDEATADAAAAGWDGGIYRAWTDGNAVASVLRTVWDTSADARQFAAAIAEWIAAGDGTASVSGVKGASVDVAFASDRSTLDALLSASPTPSSSS